MQKQLQPARAHFGLNLKEIMFFIYIVYHGNTWRVQFTMQN